MFHARTSGKFLAVVAGGALLLTACGGNDSASKPAASGSAAASAPASAQSINYAFDQEFSSYNGNTSAENAARNNQPLQRVLTGFWYYGGDGAVTPDTDFGTYEKVSDDPLTVKYTINPAATWSDGTPIDCDDLALSWAANSGKVEGFSTAGTTGWELTDAPKCDKGGKEITHVYSEPFADWRGGLYSQGQIMPAHVVEKKGNISEEELIAAVKDGDAKKLADAIKFYNDGWIMKGTLLSEDLIPSSGPYKLSKIDAGQSLTLVANDKYWGAKPAIQTVVERYIALDQQAQALQNGEVNIAVPQPGPDVLNQLNALEAVTVKSGPQYFFDHLDFNFDSSPFKDRTLREAFAKCVPRQLIVDNLIKPLNPEAKILQARITSSVQASYADIVTGLAGEEKKYDAVDIDGAKALLEKAGKTGLEVKIGYNTPNPRRTSVVQLISDSCNKAGFKVKDNGAEDFFGTGLANNTYDVALFGWTGSSLISGSTSTYTSVKKCDSEHKGNNNGCYENKKVDELLKKANATVDEAGQTPLLAEAEKIMWQDLATIPLYENPNLTAWSEGVGNVVPNPTQAGIGWNMDKWTIS
ncbi:ABC transporter family substrate-binding protein [Streptosporangium sp. NBC_01756]|uniref:ABC transporter family substrate-binding protein n=1 Tax=Streptosporangium sp. NBC_01756 TaxID=2975950 RepID=UPI002DDA26F3|nr:ABC transporter family substrate-binding protein [Streptosporangium sp. NBC_01756]WSC88108.1 ABC transporter family substrate-binding protein [Streptosporangium sp. NBC_01756]